MHKTVLFCGAGLTAGAGMPATATQDDIFRELFFAQSEEEFCAHCEKKHLLTRAEAAQLYALEQLPGERLATGALLREYVRSFTSKESFKMQSLLNLLELQRLGHYSFRNGAYASYYPIFYEEQFLLIRRRMLALLEGLFTIKVRRAQQAGSLDKYKDFFRAIAECVLREKYSAAEQLGEAQLRSRDFILSDLTYVCLNWDPLFLWCMFNAHKELNERNELYFPHARGNAKLKIFNDFGTPLATEPIKDRFASEVWYPYDEAVAYHINDKEHLGDRIVTLLRTLFPHGQTNWLACPICGKVSMYLGHAWELNSPTLPLPLLGEGGRKLQCVHCQQELTACDAAMLLQTVHKEVPAYLQEIQTEMRLRIAEAHRIIFIGYSLPEDDIDYRSILAALGSDEKKEIYVVGYAPSAEDKWYEYEAIKQVFASKGDKVHLEEVERYHALYDKAKQLRFNFVGFPAAAQSILALLRGVRIEG